MALNERRRRQLERRLTALSGAETVAAESARAALARLLTGPFDALVSDIAMPERDGIALIREIRGLADTHKRRIPALALSAFAGDEERERALTAGFQRHLAKPITTDQLVNCVKAAIRDVA